MMTSGGLGKLGLDRELGMIMNANRANPEQFAFRLKEQQRAGITPQLLDVLASQKLLKEKQDAKAAMMANVAPSAGTIAQQQDAMLKQQAVADLQKEVDVAKQVGMGNAIANLRNKRLQKNALKQLTGAGKSKGIMVAAQGGPVNYENGGIIDLIKQNPVAAASLGLLAIPGFGLAGAGVGLGLRALAGLGRYAIPRLGKVLFSKPGMFGQAATGTGLGLANLEFDLDEKFGVDPVETPKGPTIYDEPIGPEKPEDKPKDDDKPIPTGPLPDSPLKGPEDIPTLETLSDYKPDRLGQFAQYMSSFLGGNPAAVAAKQDKTDFERQRAIDEANLGIEQQNISNLIAGQGLKFDYAKLQEDTNLRKDINLFNNKTALVDRLNKAAKTRSEAEKDFNESMLGATLGRRLEQARAKLINEGKGEKEFALLSQQLKQAKDAYLAPYDGVMAAIQERLDALDFNLDQKPIQIN